MLAGDKAADKAVPAEKSESGRDSGTEEKAAGLTQAKRKGQALSPDKSVDEADDRVRERGEDGKFQKTSKDGGEASKEDKSAEGEDGPQKRINKAVKAQREAERKAEQLQREIEELKKGSGKTSEEKKDDKPKQKADPDPKEPKKPKQEDFASFEEFIDALTDYKADLRDFQREKKERETRQAEARKQAATAWDKKKDAARDKYDDYDDVMEEHGSTPVNQATHNFIAESEIGPELGYYLASHREEAAEIFKMSPTRAVKALGKIEDKLTAEPEKPAEKETKPAKKELPKPARNVGGSATPKEPKLDDPDIDFGTFKRIARTSLSRER